MQSGAVRKDPVEVDGQPPTHGERPSIFVLIGIGESHGNGRTPLACATRTSASAV